MNEKLRRMTNTKSLVLRLNLRILVNCRRWIYSCDRSADGVTRLSGRIVHPGRNFAQLWGRKSWIGVSFS